MRFETISWAIWHEQILQMRALPKDYVKKEGAAYE